MTSAMLVSTVKVKIAKPLTHTWEEAGDMLRALSFYSHRVLNGTTRRLALAHHHNREHPELIPTEWRSASGRADAYNMAKSAIAEAAGHAQFGADKTGEVGALKTRLEQRAALTIPSSITNGWAKFADGKFKNEARAISQGDKSLPSFRKSSPICFQSGCGAALVRHDGSGYTLDVPLSGEGRAIQRVTFALTPDGASSHAHMRRIVADTNVKMGDVKILPPRPTKKAWLACISYSWPRPEAKTGGVMVVHRGMRSMLCAATGIGGDRKAPAFNVIANGADVLAMKAKMRARRASLGKLAKEIGHGGRGHGTDRRFEMLRSLDDAEERFVRTKCQQAGAEVARIAAARGVGEVWIEDFGTIEPKEGDPPQVEMMLRQWPFFKLKEAIRWACEKNGIAFREMPTAYVSQRCPIETCGHTSAANVNSATHTFHCEVCQESRSSDQVACWNMLRSIGVDPGIKEAKAKESTIRKALKKTTKAATGGHMKEEKKR